MYTFSYSLLGAIDDSYTHLFVIVHSYTLTSANNPELVFFKQLSDTDIAAADL